MFTKFSSKEKSLTKYLALIKTNSTTILNLRCGLSVLYSLKEETTNQTESLNVKVLVIVEV